MRNFLFKTFDLNKERLEKLDELPFDTKSAIIADMPCITFEYDLKKDLQGKTIDEALNNLKEAIELYNESEEAVKPKEIFITTLEVAI